MTSQDQNEEVPKKRQKVQTENEASNNHDIIENENERDDYQSEEDKNEEWVPYYKQCKKQIRINCPEFSKACDMG